MNKQKGFVGVFLSIIAALIILGGITYFAYHKELEQPSNIQNAKPGIL